MCYVHVASYNKPLNVDEWTILNPIKVSFAIVRGMVHSRRIFPKKWNCFAVLLHVFNKEHNI